MSRVNQMYGLLRQRIGAVAFLVCVASLLPSSAAAGDSGTWSLRFGSSPFHFHEKSFDNAVVSFFGPSDSSGFLNLSGEDLISSGSSVKVSPRLPVGLRLSWRKPLARGKIRPFVEAGGSFGSATYFLPEGARPFIDPITVKVSSFSADLQLGVEASVRAVDLSAGGGISLTHAQTSIRSALLNVRDSTTFKTPFLFTNASWSPTPGFSVSLGAMWTKDNKWEPTWGGSWAF